MVVEIQKLERQLEKRQKETPTDESYLDGLELDLKNLKFKVKYLQDKVQKEEMFVDTLETKKKMVGKRVGEQIAKESEFVNEAKLIGIDFEDSQQ